MLVFWLTPIIYDAQLAPALLQRVLYMNPFSYFILAYQDALYRNVFSSLEQWVVIMLLAAVFLAAGYTLFTTCKSRFAEEA